MFPAFSNWEFTLMRSSVPGIFHMAALIGELLIAMPSVIPAQQAADILTPRLQWKPGVVTVLAMSPAGKLIATDGAQVTFATSTTPGYTRGEVRLWNAQTGALVRSLAVENDKIASLAFSPDGNLLAAGGGNQQLPHDPIRITVWDVGSGSVNRTLDGYDEDVINLAFLGNSDGLVAVGYSRRPDTLPNAAGPKVLKMWERRGGDVAWTMKWPITAAFSFGRNKTGDVLLAVDGYIEGPRDRDIRKPGQAIVELWNLSDKSKTAVGADGDMRYVQFKEVSVSANGSVVAGGNAQSIEAWGNTLHFEVRSDYPKELFNQIALSPDGSILAVVSTLPRSPGTQQRSHVRLWDLASNTVVGKLLEGEGAPALIDALMFSPDGSSLVTADVDGNIKVWDLKRRSGN